MPGEKSEEKVHEMPYYFLELHLESTIISK
jgi:hypothetical protein